MRVRDVILGAICIAAGLGFAYVDSRPTWDDAGVLALSIAIASALAASIRPQRWWLWALLVGAWVPAHNIANGGGYASVVALAFAFGGALVGAGIDWARPRLGPVVE